MKRLLKTITIMSLVMLNACNKDAKQPEAEIIAKEFLEFGNTRIDNYYWMNDRKNPKALAYLKAENAYLENTLGKRTKKLQDKIYKELKARQKEIDSTVPYLENGYYYYMRYEKDKDYEIYCRKENLDSAENILLDVNQLAEKYDFVDVDEVIISPDNRTMAYAIDTMSRGRYEIRFVNLTNGVPLTGKIKNTDGDIVFANDSRTTFYVSKDPQTLRGFKLFRHIIGQDVMHDKEIFYEEDPVYELSLEKSKSGKYIFLNHYNSISCETRIIPASNPYAEPIVFRKRQKNLEYYVDHCNGKFFIRTNENAKNFCIVTCDSTSYNNNWKVIVPHRDSVFIEDFEVFDKFLVVNERRNGLNVFEIINLENNESHLLDFGQETYDAWFEDNPEPKSELLRYGYSSFNTPCSTIDYDMRKREKTILKEEIVNNFNKSDYEVKRIFVEARDGAKIPVSMLYKKDINLNGNNNLLQYAYGAYGYSEEDSFFQSIFSLVDRGFVFALAHVRGGSELGQQWYENGKLLNKKNTFNDFVDVSKYLIDNKITSPQKLYAQGGSAGGLLMGVIANTNPELYRGIIAEVPFVDVVTTMLDETIPLTSGEYDEWGNPNDKNYYDYILSYSPYDNITQQDYPNMLVTTGLHDSQVQYWEPAKYVAKLRSLKTDDNNLYLYTNLSAGHHGASGRTGRFKEKALQWAFILDLAGFKEK